MKKNGDRFFYLSEDEFPDDDDWTDDGDRTDEEPRDDDWIDRDAASIHKKRNKRNHFVS